MARPYRSGRSILRRIFGEGSCWRYRRSRHGCSREGAPAGACDSSSRDPAKLGAARKNWNRNLQTGKERAAFPSAPKKIRRHTPTNARYLCNWPRWLRRCERGRAPAPEESRLVGSSLGDGSPLSTVRSLLRALITVNYRTGRVLNTFPLSVLELHNAHFLCLYWKYITYVSASAIELMWIWRWSRYAEKHTQKKRNVVEAINASDKMSVPVTGGGDGFGNKSYLVVHLLTLATCWFDFRQKERFSFSEYIYNLKMCSLHVQWFTYLSKYTNLVQ